MATDPVDACLRWLTRREHSRVELTRKLNTRFPELSKAEIKALLDDLGERGLQSDQRFAEMLMRTRVHQGHGRSRIARELATHQIGSDETQALWEPHADDESLRCQEALHKWMRGKAHPTREKALRFLASRGFEFSDASEAVEVIFR